MGDIIVRQILLGPFQVFTYLVACSHTEKAVVIDPAGEEKIISALLEEEGVETKYILNTHGHADHVIANQRLKDLLSVPVCMHGLDDEFFSQSSSSAPSSVDIRLKDGDTLDVGSLKIEVIHTPGHTPGSVCFLVNGNLFTGDTLFVGAAGRTDLPGASLETLIESLEKKLLVLPPETIVWPGHDYGETPTSTLAREMEENIYITDFILDS